MATIAEIFAVTGFAILLALIAVWGWTAWCQRGDERWKLK